MAMKDVKTAADLRRVIEKIGTNVIDRERPPVRIGRVFSYNTDTNTAMVLFPGNTIEGLVPATFGKNMIPSSAMIDTFDTDGYSATGDVVRVAGKPNDWYIAGYSVGLPVSEHTQLTGVTNFDLDFLNVTSLGDQVIPLHKVPIVESIHVYWGGAFLPDIDWTLADDGRSITVSDPNHRIKVGRLLTAKYAWVEADQTPPLPVDHFPITLDLPAFNVVDHSTDIPISGGNILSVADGNPINCRTTNFALQNYGNGPGAPTSYTGDAAGLFPPEGAVPDGYVVSSAVLVAIGYVSGDEAAGASPEWDGMDPYPTRAPFLELDHTSAIGNTCLSGFPVGGYDGEIVVPGLYRNGYPVVRCFYDWETTNTYDLFLDYLAARVTYVWGG